MSDRQSADEKAMRCCGGSGVADHATAPCTVDGCGAAARRFAETQEQAEAPSSALAAHDDMVGYSATPVFDAIVVELGFGDPRGARVQTWEEIRYASGRRGRLDAGEDGGGDGAAERKPGRRRRGTNAGETVAVPGDGGAGQGEGGERAAG